MARCMHRNTPVFACFLDASKAFDLVNHNFLFQLLLDRGLPVCVVRLLRDWYTDQKLSVRWNSQRSHSVRVSNSVRQGGVLSPVLFTIYIDKLLLELRQQGVWCYWNSHFAGAYAYYADDLTILASLYPLSDRCWVLCLPAQFKVQPCQNATSCIKFSAYDTPQYKVLQVLMP